MSPVHHTDLAQWQSPMTQIGWPAPEQDHGSNGDPGVPIRLEQLPSRLHSIGPKWHLTAQSVHAGQAVVGGHAVQLVMRRLRRLLWQRGWQSSSVNVGPLAGCRGDAHGLLQQQWPAQQDATIILLSASPGAILQRRMGCKRLPVEGNSPIPH